LDPDIVCAKISDFGTAQLVTQPITIRKVDNPVWQAPEILRSEPYNHKVDTYAYGVILFELLTRDTYFGEVKFISDLSVMVENGKRPKVPDEISHRIYKKAMNECWHQDPGLRPQMASVIQDLQTIRVDDAIQATYSEYEAEWKARNQVLETFKIILPNGSEYKCHDQHKIINDELQAILASQGPQNNLDIPIDENPDLMLSFAEYMSKYQTNEIYVGKNRGSFDGEIKHSMSL